MCCIMQRGISQCVYTICVYDMWMQKMAINNLTKVAFQFLFLFNNNFPISHSSLRIDSIQRISFISKNRRLELVSGWGLHAIRWTGSQIQEFKLTIFILWCVTKCSLYICRNLPAIYNKPFVLGFYVIRIHLHTSIHLSYCCRFHIMIFIIRGLNWKNNIIIRQPSFYYNISIGHTESNIKFRIFFFIFIPHFQKSWEWEFIKTIEWIVNEDDRVERVCNGMSNCEKRKGKTDE